MEMSKSLFYTASSVAVSIGMMLSSTANAGSYYHHHHQHRPVHKPCPQLKHELTAKVHRLRHMAREREYHYGDAYGARRLRNNANIITAHIGNLPCVNKQTCLT